MTMLGAPQPQFPNLIGTHVLILPLQVDPALAFRLALCCHKRFPSLKGGLEPTGTICASRADRSTATTASGFAWRAHADIEALCLGLRLDTGCSSSCRLASVLLAVLLVAIASSISATATAMLQHIEIVQIMHRGTQLVNAVDRSQMKSAFLSNRECEQMQASTSGKRPIPTNSPSRITPTM